MTYSCKHLFPWRPNLDLADPDSGAKIPAMPRFLKAKIRALDSDLQNAAAPPEIREKVHEIAEAAETLQHDLQTAEEQRDDSKVKLEQTETQLNECNEDKARLRDQVQGRDADH